MIKFDAIPDVATRFPESEAPYYVPHAHVFDSSDIAAIEAALNTRRPLLLRGEPGVGKSQLALAAAMVLSRSYVQHVVNALTEPNDLLWDEDAVRRLADAQIFGAEQRQQDAQDASSVENKSDEGGPKYSDPRRRENYLTPGALWWAFQWKTAAGHSKDIGIQPPAMPTKNCDPDNGSVVLIDEIDKAGAEVPNSLLEAFGSRQFYVPGRKDPVVAKKNKWPLVVITTNEERVLPNAFLRRCVVHDIKMPDDADGLENYLVKRAEAHFGEEESQPGFYRKAAKLMVVDRNTAQRNQWEPLPGLAEYLDLIRAVEELCARSTENKTTELQRLKNFFFRKHPDSKSDG